MAVPRNSAAAPEEFSPWFFLAALAVTVTAAGAVLRLAAPSVWSAQFAASWWQGIAAFLGLTLLNCFIEYFFHRYVLHRPAIPGLGYFYRQHTLHHALTRVVRKRRPGGGGILVIENQYPIVRSEQKEASFFPWYSAAIFILLLTPGFALLQRLDPSAPWMFAGFAAVAGNLMLYEFLHAIEHWPLARWLPLIEHPRWGGAFRKIYGFHLRHHAVNDCNESISGFFGLPVADWVLGTCVIPETRFADGEPWLPAQFAAPRPCRIIRWCDAVAARMVNLRRTRTAAPALPAESPLESATLRGRLDSIAEAIGNSLTHGIGLLLSVVGLIVLVVDSLIRGDAWHFAGFTVFGVTLVLRYAASPFYFSVRSERWKRFFLRFDHASIFLVIAGTYTPFLLTSLRGPWGWSLFGVIWGLCGTGALLHFVLGNRFKRVSTIAYFLLGWMIVVAVQPLCLAVPAGGLWLLLAGGICYTLGVSFYRWHRLRYHQLVWRGFVFGGSACHYLAVLLFLLPSPGLLGP